MALYNRPTPGSTLAITILAIIRYKTMPPALNGHYLSLLCYPFCWIELPSLFNSIILGPLVAHSSNVPLHLLKRRTGITKNNVVKKFYTTWSINYTNKSNLLSK